MTSRRVRLFPRTVEYLGFRLLILLILAIGLAMFFIWRWGLPPDLVSAVLRRIDSGPLAIEADGGGLDRLDRIVLHGIRVYWRGHPGPPLLEAREVTLTLDPAALLKRQQPLRAIRVRHGVLRPDAMQTPRSRDAPTMPGSDRTLSRFAATVTLEQCHVLGVMLESLRTGIIADGERIALENLRGDVTDGIEGGQRGTLRGAGSYELASGHFVGAFDLVMFPAVALPVLEALNLSSLIRFLKDWRFGDAQPDIRLKIDHQDGGDRLDIRGLIRLKHATCRDVAIDEGEAVMHMQMHEDRDTLTLAPVRIERPEGKAEGTLTVDFEKKTVRFDATSTLHPHGLRQALRIFDDPLWDRLTFTGPDRIAARGIVGYRTHEATDFAAEFSGAGLSFASCRAADYALTLRMRGSSVSLADIDLALYGGRMTGTANLLLTETPSSNATYAVALQADALDFQRVAELLIGDDPHELKGRLSGALELRGHFGDTNLTAAAGSGKLHIEKGRVFMLPIFGGLSAFMTRYIPGLDFILRQSDAGADFVIADGRVSSENIAIQGDVLSLSARGYYTFSEALDFHVQLRLMREKLLVARLVRMLTYPITKLLEFRVRGSLDEPRWYPVNFSSDLLRTIGIMEREE